MQYIYPFTAIVGQEKMKKALILNAINPKIGGVLIRGEKGTAKSTAVRALADLLPEIEVVEGCPFNCDPNGELCDICKEKKERGELRTTKKKMKVVNLPIGATEDRVIGTLDIEKAIKEGIKALEPGILAEANRNILYIDEVNLLDDHIIDVLLDAAAMGWNIIEREGVKIKHPSRFILVGTMNPEEGELRPQILDRFGLMVNVEGLNNIKERIEVIKRVEEFNENPEEFYKRFEEEQNKLRERIIKAREILKDVEISDDLLEFISKVCIELGIQTNRADITVVRTAKALAAYNGRTKVNINDVKEAMELALPHRMRRKPFEPPQLNKEKLEQMINEFKQQKNDENNEEEKEEQNDNDVKKKHDEIKNEFEEGSSEDEKDNNNPNNQNNQDENTNGDFEQTFGIDESFKVNPKLIQFKLKDNIYRYSSGRHIKSYSKRGRYIKFKLPKDKTTDIAFDATFRRAVIHQKRRKERADKKLAIYLEKEDIVEKVRQRKISSHILFVVDASGSMGAMRRMEAAKGAIISLLLDAYQKRNKIGMIAFRKDKAELILPFTSSVELGEKLLRDLPTGGKTPLADAFIKSYEVFDRELRKNPNIIPIMIVISDFKPNVAVKGDYVKEVFDACEKIAEKGINVILIDTEPQSFIKIGIGREIANRFGFKYYKIEELSKDKILDICKSLEI